MNHTLYVDITTVLQYKVNSDSTNVCVFTHKVHLELSTTVHVLTHELSTNVLVFTQSSFGTRHKCACTHT